MKIAIAGTGFVGYTAKLLARAPAVIASEARQSMHLDTLDCHVANAPRNDEKAADWLAMNLSIE